MDVGAAPGGGDSAANEYVASEDESKASDNK
jgi:hypothetical protein